MRILFDQGTPVPLRRYLADHDVKTAYEMGWSQLSNGRLLSEAESAGFELLLTTDQNLSYQQNLSKRRIAVRVLPTTRWPEIKNNVQRVTKAIQEVQPGTYGWISFEL